MGWRGHAVVVANHCIKLVGTRATVLYVVLVDAPPGRKRTQSESKECHDDHSYEDGYEGETVVPWAFLCCRPDACGGMRATARQGAPLKLRVVEGVVFYWLPVFPRTTGIRCSIQAVIVSDVVIFGVFRLFSGLCRSHGCTSVPGFVEQVFNNHT